MANELVVVDDQRKSRVGWIMVPEMQYMSAVENCVADQFDRLQSCILSQKLKVHEHLLGMLQMTEFMMIREIQLAAYDWARKAAEWTFDSDDRIITREYAASEVLNITKGHFSVIHRDISSFGLVDFKDKVQILVALELQNLERYLNWHLCMLIRSWK